MTVELCRRVFADNAADQMCDLIDRMHEQIASTQSQQECFQAVQHLIAEAARYSRIYAMAKGANEDAEV